LWARLLKAEGAIMSAAQSVLSLGRALDAAWETSDDPTHGLQRCDAGEILSAVDDEKPRLYRTGRAGTSP